MKKQSRRDFSKIRVPCKKIFSAFDSLAGEFLSNKSLMSFETLMEIHEKSMPSSSLGMARRISDTAYFLSIISRWNSKIWDWPNETYGCLFLLDGESQGMNSLLVSLNATMTRRFDTYRWVEMLSPWSLKKAQSDFAAMDEDWSDIDVEECRDPHCRKCISGSYTSAHDWSYRASSGGVRFIS